MLEVKINQAAPNQYPIDNLLDLVHIAKKLHDKAQSLKKKFNVWHAVSSIPLAIELVNELSDYQRTITEINDLDGTEFAQLIEEIKKLWQIDDLERANVIAQSIVFPIIQGLISIATGVFNAFELPND